MSKNAPPKIMGSSPPPRPPIAAAAEPLNLMDMDLPMPMASRPVPLPTAPSPLAALRLPAAPSISALQPASTSAELDPAQQSAIRAHMIDCMAASFSYSYYGAIPVGNFTRALSQVCGLDDSQAKAIVDVLWLNGYLTRTVAETKKHSMEIFYRCVATGFAPDAALGMLLSRPICAVYLRPTREQGFALTPLQRRQVVYALQTVASKGGLVHSTKQEQGEAALHLLSLKARLPAAVKERSSEFQDKWVRDTPEGQQFVKTIDACIKALEDAKLAQ